MVYNGEGTSIRLFACKRAHNGSLLLLAFYGVRYRITVNYIGRPVLSITHTLSYAVSMWKNSICKSYHFMERVNDEIAGSFFVASIVTD